MTTTARIVRAAYIATARAWRRITRRYEARHAARTSGHRVVDHHQRALIAYRNAGHTLAIDYLRSIGFPEADKYASAFGRAVAAQYRKTHSAEPYKGCLVIVRGRLTRCYGYADDADLVAGAYAYKRTREHLASQRTTALHALAA